jgi:phosphatidylethanolamine-binding protein (PEBP) family uncharacterized protein
VYALSRERCPVEGENFTAPQVLQAIRGLIVAEATLIGTYSLNPSAIKA